MTARTKISFIIPVYNAAPFLSRLLDSLQSQETDANWEALFTDDGSSDASLRILREAEIQDARIRVFEISHEGSSGARNKGLENATGDIIAFIDADDFIHPKLIKTVLPYFDDASVDAVMYDFMPVEPNTVPTFPELSIPPPSITLTDPIKWALQPWKPTAHGVWRTFYRRSIIGEIRFFPKIKHQDLLFSYQIWGNISKMLKLNCTLYAYVQTSGSVIRSDYSSDKIDANFIIINELNSYFSNRPYIQNMLKRILFPRRVKDVWKQVDRAENSSSGPLHRQFFEKVNISLKSGLFSPWSFSFFKMSALLYHILRLTISKTK